MAETNGILENDNREVKSLVEEFKEKFLKFN